MITNRNSKSQQRQNERNVDRYTHYLDRLTELSLAMFEWKNVPDEVDLRYLEFLLFTSGQCVFFKDDDLGEEGHFLVTRTALQGKLNIYDIPINRMAYANNGYRRELTEDDSVIIYNNMIRTPAGVDVIMFARDLANIDEIVQVNINAQRTPVLIEADEKQRLTMLNLYRKYSGNEPFIFGNKTMDLGNGLKVLKTDAPFLADRLYTLKTQIWNEALTYLGISNINITKKERLITDEVTRNQGGTIASRYSRLESRRTACKKINDLFGLEMWVDYREDYQSTELVASDTVSGDPNSEGIGGEEINPIEKTASNLETKTEAKAETKSDDTSNKKGFTGNDHTITERGSIMSQTMLVKDICEMFGEYRTPTGFSQKKEVINKAVDQVFSFEYPIYDEAYRSVLNKKILNHFYMRDIGQESIGLWQHYLETTLNEIMPYYNQLFESELLKFNPLLDVDLEKTYTKGVDGTKTGNSTLDAITDYIRDLQASTNGTSDSTSDSTVSSTTSADTSNNTDKDDWNLFLDTPQGGLGSFYGVENADGSTGKYLTEARHEYGEQTDVTNSTGENDTVSGLINSETNTNTVDETGTTKSTVANESSSTENTMQNEEYTESVKGKQGGASFSKMLLEFRDTILNIDRLILKDLEPLFYGLW